MSSPRKRTRAAKQRNPLETFRAPWKTDGEPTKEVSNWRPVLHQGNRVAIEVIGDEPTADVIVYIHDSRFISTEQSQEYDTLEGRDRWEWVKENATRIVRGEVGEHETFCIRHTALQDVCGVACEKTDSVHSGWRGLLWSFLNQGDYWDRLAWDTPVLVNRDYLTDLNHASLPTAQLRNCHHAIKQDALGAKDYEEKNEDVVSDMPEAAGASFLADKLLGKHTTSARVGFTFWNDNGTGYREFNTGPNMMPAVEKWLDIVHRLQPENLAAELPRGAELRDDFIEHIRGKFRNDLIFEIKHSFETWTRDEWREHARHPLAKAGKLTEGNAWLADLEHSERDLPFLEYEHNDSTEQEVSDATRQLLPGDGGVIEDEFFDDVAAALEREDITWSREDPYNYSVMIDADWVFTIDVDSLGEQLDDLVREFDVPEEDE